MAILNQATDLSIRDTFNTCYETSIGGQCYPAIGAYLRMAANTKPHYPVPAIPLRVVHGTDYMADTVYIERLNYGEDDPVIVSVLDVNFDRCMDFGTPIGKFYIPEEQPSMY